jgi:hypothetical protein
VRRSQLAAAQLLPERRERRAGLYTLDRHRHYCRGVRCTSFPAFTTWGQDSGGLSGVRGCRNLCLDVTGCIYICCTRCVLAPSARVNAPTCVYTPSRVRTNTLSVHAPHRHRRGSLRPITDKRKYAAGENAGETYAPICGIYTPDVYTPDGIYTLAETDERRRLCRWGDGGGGDDT